MTLCIPLERGVICPQTQSICVAEVRSFVRDMSLRTADCKIGKMTKGLKETPNFATSSLTDWLTAPGCKGCRNFIVCQYERKNRRNVWNLHTRNTWLEKF